MKDHDQEQVALPHPQHESIAEIEKRYRDEVRFWQGVALNLAAFALGLIASLIISLVVLLMGL